MTAENAIRMVYIGFGLLIMSAAQNIWIAAVGGLLAIYSFMNIIGGDE